MFNPESILLLEKRIGWNSPISSLPPIEVSDYNLKSTSGRTFKSFHELVSVDNLYWTLPSVDISNEDLNEYISNIRKEAAIQAISKVLKHPDYCSTRDYDKLISEQPILFDDVIGYGVVIRCFEIYISSNRSNSDERNAKLSYESLKVELEGIRNENGYTVSVGINSKFNKAIKEAQRIIFPTKIKVIGGHW